MITENKNGLRILYAEGTNKITNSGRSFFSDLVYLGKNDIVDNYEEVSYDIWRNFIKVDNPDLVLATKKITDLEAANEELVLMDNMLMIATDETNTELSAIDDMTMLAVDDLFVIIESLEKRIVELEGGGK